MNNSFNFSKLSNQSPRGILVIYFKQLYNLLKVSWVFLFIIFKDFSKLSNLSVFYIYSAAIVLLLFFLIRAYLVFKNFKFKIADNQFILQKGIIKKTNTSIAFERIQNINFKQNLIQQIINVYEVSIETAGSVKTEIAIKALSLEKAKALKELILEDKSVTIKKATTTIKKPLLKISVLELFKVSLTENHLRNLILFLAILMGFFQQIQQIADSFGKTETLDGFIKESSSAITPSFIIVFTFVIFLAFTAFLTSFIRIFLVHFNLTAFLKKDAFEINQGLFTKKSILLKTQKVQNIIVSTNPLKRLIGISYVTFKQAVSGRVNKKTDKTIKIVGCKKNQVAIIKNTLFKDDDLDTAEKKYPASYYKKRVYLFSFLFFSVAYISLLYFYWNKLILASLLVTIPIVLLLIHKKLKKRFYKTTDEFLMVGNGLLETHFTYLEFFKVQNIKMKQTYFQERSNVADVVLQTASGKITLPCLELKKASNLYNYVVYKIETSRKEWM